MGNRSEKRLSTLALAAGVTILTAVLWYLLSPNLSTSSGEAQPTRVYFADRISAAHLLLIERFNRLHHGRIEVVPVDLPFEKFSTNERKELLARSLRGGSDKLDLFAVDLIWVPRFARWSEPLNPYFDQDDRSRVIPVALRSCLVDSMLVSMPLYIDVGLMYYREDLLRKLPDARRVEARLSNSISWPEFLDLRSRLGYGKKPFYVFQADEYEGLVCNYLELVMAGDPAFLSAGRMNFTTPSARSALAMLVDFVHGSRISPPEVVEFDENRSYKYALDHDALFVRGWPNFVENFRKTYPDTAKLGHIRKAALPHFEGKEPTSVFGGWNLMLSKYSTRKQEALEFIRFVQTNEAQRLMYETEGFLPITREVYEDSLYMQNHPDLAYYYTLLRRGFHRPAIVDYTRISDIISYYARRAIRGDLPVPVALEQATEMINANKVLVK